MNIDTILHPGESARQNLAVIDRHLADLDRRIAAAKDAGVLEVRSEWIATCKHRNGYLAVWLKDGSAVIFGSPEKPVPEIAADILALTGGRFLRRWLEKRHPHQAAEAAELRRTMDLIERSKP